MYWATAPSDIKREPAESPVSHLRPPDYFDSYIHTQDSDDMKSHQPRIVSSQEEDAAMFLMDDEIDPPGEKAEEEHASLQHEPSTFHSSLAHLHAENVIQNFAFHTSSLSPPLSHASSMTHSPPHDRTATRPYDSDVYMSSSYPLHSDAYAYHTSHSSIQDPSLPHQGSSSHSIMPRSVPSIMIPYSGYTSHYPVPFSARSPYDSAMARMDEDGPLSAPEWGGVDRYSSSAPISRMNPYYTPTTTINPMSLLSPSNTPATAVPTSPAMPTSFSSSFPSPSTATQAKPISKKTSSSGETSPVLPKKEELKKETEGTFACVCGKRYASLNALKNHAKLHTVRERNFVCETCKKAFLRKQDLKRHETTHLEDYHPYCCDNCGTTFTRSDALSRHIKARRCMD